MSNSCSVCGATFRNPNCERLDCPHSAETAGADELARLRALNEELVEALEFYATPETYHAISFLADPPCGEFADDFSEDHGDDFYDRQMPGARARAALALARAKEQSNG